MYYGSGLGAGRGSPEYSGRKMQAPECKKVIKTQWMEENASRHHLLHFITVLPPHFFLWAEVFAFPACDSFGYSSSHMLAQQALACCPLLKKSNRNHGFQFLRERIWLT
jgi:hypothetical protein